MVIKLHGYAISVATRRVAVVLKELELPYELIPVDVNKGEHKSPEYKKIQPFGQVPYIVSGYLFRHDGIHSYLG